jgi:hypothetical protein
VKHGPGPPTPAIGSWSRRAVGRDHLGPATGLPEGPLDEVGVADAAPVLAWEAQVHCQFGQSGGQARKRRRVQGLIAVGERLRAAGRLVDGGLPGWLVDVVEDLPERGLDLGLGTDGDLGQEVAATVKP